MSNKEKGGGVKNRRKRWNFRRLTHLQGAMVSRQVHWRMPAEDTVVWSVETTEKGTLLLYLQKEKGERQNVPILWFIPPDACNRCWRG